MAKRYWLFKTEPSTFSWDDLLAAKDKTTAWDGVRNYQARNMLRDEIKPGDGVLFYYSQVKPQVIVGTAKVVKAGYPDPTQHQAKSKYYDADSDPKNPRWFLVDIQADAAFNSPVSLPELKETPGLEGMVLLQKGSRLSVQPVTPEQWKVVIALGKRKPKA